MFLAVARSACAANGVAVQARKAAAHILGWTICKCQHDIAISEVYRHAGAWCLCQSTGASPMMHLAALPQVL